MKNLMAFNSNALKSAPLLPFLATARTLAVATLLLTVQGQEVVASGKRRWVDAHWLRGNSYFRIGWNWVKGCLHQDWQLFPTISLLGHPDPAPAIASKKQAQQQFEREFTVKSYQFTA